MAWTTKATKAAGNGDGGTFERAPAGNHPAVLVALIDMGTQEVDGFQGAPSKEQHRAYMVWELVAEQNSQGENFLIAIDLNISLNEKAKLRKWIEARRGRPIADGEEYDISEELGKPCLLNVVEKNGYPKIEGVSGVPKGTTVPKPTRPLTAWTLEQYASEGRVDVPDWLPWHFGKPITDHIMECKEIVTGDVAPGSAPSAAPTKTGTKQTAKPAPPPRKPAPPPPASKFWVALSDSAEPMLMTTAEVKHAYETSQGVDWSAVQLCLDGSEQWLPLATLIPESKSWNPF